MQESEANYDLFEKTASLNVTELPDIQNIRDMFIIYNSQYFSGKLPKIKITYSKRMLAAGGYYPQKKEIRISEKYHTIFPDEVYDTLKHEMIHIIYPKHDAKFKRMAGQIGASVRANAHPDLRRPPKYLYVCPKCGIEYPRRKRFRMASCGKCSKGKFDNRYKLILKKK